MIFRANKVFMLLALFSMSLSIVATHYENKTGRTITITNVTAKNRNKKSFFSLKRQNKKDGQSLVTFIRLEDGSEGDLDNKQGDEITITSRGMSNKRKLFPTNNSFNYVVTMNNYKSKFEQFDINHAE